MSNDDNLPTVTPSKRSVQLHGTGSEAGSLIDNALHNLSKEQVSVLAQKAAGEALRLEVKAREQNMDYSAGRRAAEDHIETFNMLDRKGKLTRQVVKSDIRTGAGNMRIESKTGATCFVASAAYGDPNHPDVMFLRWYRDAVLSKTSYGLKFTRWYYANGPKLALVVKKSRLLCALSKKAIGLIVRFLVIKEKHLDL